LAFLAQQIGSRNRIIGQLKHGGVGSRHAHLRRQVLAGEARPAIDHEGAEQVNDRVAVCSMMWVNNEIGTIQPVAALAAKAKERGAIFHTDAVQAFGKVPIDARTQQFDLLTISGHKFGAPKGIGALFIRRGTNLEPLLHGGTQDRGRRPGTENVPAAMAFARAVQLCGTGDSQAVSAMRDFFEAAVCSPEADIEINGARALRLPNTSNLLFRGVSAEALVIALDMQGIAVSTGSACSSGSVEASHVLLAMGLTREEARSSVRFSFGRYNTVEDVKLLIDGVTASVRRLRKTPTLENQLVF